MEESLDRQLVVAALFQGAGLVEQERAEAFTPAGGKRPIMQP